MPAQYFRIFRTVLIALAVSGPLAAPAGAAQETPPPAAVPEVELPDPQLQRPLDVPLTRPADRGQRLMERGRLENQRQRLERRGDPHDPRVQDRLRRLDRSIDRLR